MDHFLASSCLTDRWGKRAWGQAFYETTNLAWSVRISWRKCWSLLCYWWELRYDLLTTSPGKFISHAFVLPVFVWNLLPYSIFYRRNLISWSDTSAAQQTLLGDYSSLQCNARDTRKWKKKAHHSSFSFLSCVSRDVRHILIKNPLKHLFCMLSNGRLKSTTPLGHLWHWGPLLQPF